MASSVEEGGMSASAKMASAVFICFAGSVIEFSTALDFCSADGYGGNCHTHDYIWASVCGGLSMAYCMLRLLLFHLKINVPPAVDTVLGCMLVLWWVFGAAFNTRVKGVFVALSNGYFGTWIAFFAATLYAFLAFEQVGQQVKRPKYPNGFLLVAVAGAIELAVAADKCDKSDCTKKTAFAVAVGAVSLMTSLIHFFIYRWHNDKAVATTKYFAIFFMCLWAAGAGVNTSSGAPFSNPCFDGTQGDANGYFASWVAFFAAVYLVAQSVFHQAEETSLRERVAEYALASTIFICFVASAVEMSTAADFCNHHGDCDKSKWAWAIACGAVSVVVCGGRLLVMKFSSEALSSVVDTVLSVFLVLWWVMGAAFNTRVHGAFASTSNGYFATWIALLTATFYAYLAIARLQAALEGNTAGSAFPVVLAGSAVVLAVAADSCDARDDCSKKFGWAVAAGVVSFCVCATFFFLQRFKADMADKLEKPVAVFLVAWWAAGAGVTTSAHAPFDNPCGTANGYFAVWTSFFAALVFCAGAFGMTQQPRTGYEAL
eukprot:m.423116 g.423116  ORF g.423116 m.423116 type:complete len:544 (+) comp20207_c0_seq4:1821-3452(+)